MLWSFAKYHALGNDYLVIDPKDLPSPLTTAQVKTICHRNFGVGSDGILLGPLPAANAKFALKIYNPDGSIAEKSGNGLRIYSRYLWDRKLVGNDEFTIQIVEPALPADDIAQTYQIAGLGPAADIAGETAMHRHRLRRVLDSAESR